MECLVRRAVSAIRERYEEPLCLDDLARVAMMSKFHFLREFRQATGVTPARFLSAVRLHEAKRLLRTTSLRVIDISVQVGYNSVGSFARRFTESVGLPPTQYRRFCLGEMALDEGFQPVSEGRQRAGSVAGVVHADGIGSEMVYLAMFRSRIPEALPGACAVLAEPGTFHLAPVPSGTWYLLAVSAGMPPLVAPDPPVEPGLLVATAGPVRVKAGTQMNLGLHMRPLSWRDPPVLSALPGLDVAPVPARR